MIGTTQTFPSGTGKAIKKNLLYIGIYSLLFVLLSLIVFYPYLFYHKSFVWQGDGLDQHFPVFYYLGEYYKNIIQLILEGNFSQIPMIDFRIGLGFDILTTLSYYGLGDPLVLLSIFATPENMEFFYNGIILLRLYLTGIAFMLYCFYMHLDSPASVIGAFLYVFCGYSLYASVRHPFFCTAMLYFPLMLIAVEQLLSVEKKKGLLLSFITALAAISNFYFFYMLTVLSFFYGAIRFFDMHVTIDIKKTLRTFGRALFYYLLGILLAAVIFLPVLIAYKNNARLQILAVSYDLTYEWEYYLNLLYSLFTPLPINDYWSILNLTPLVLFASIALFMQKRKYRSVKIFLLLLLFLLAMPVGGSFMNGFGYVSNRWIWGISFWLSIIVVLMLKEMEYNKSTWSPLATLLLGIIGILPLLYQPLQNTYIYAGIVLSLLLLLILNFPKKRQQTFYFALLYFTAIAIFLNAACLYSPLYGKYVLEFIESRKVTEHIKDTPLILKEQIEDDDLYRISTARGATSSNKSLVMDFYGTTSYYSITDKFIANYYLDMELSSLITLCRMDGFDNRSTLETLASTKVLSEPPEIESNQLDLSDAVDLTNSVKSLPYQISPNKDIVINKEKHTIEIKKDHTHLEIEFEGLPDSETYVRLNQFIIDGSGLDYFTLTARDKENTVSSDAYPCAKEYSRYSSYYSGAENFTFHLGYSIDGKNGCTIEFPSAGTFRLDDIEIYCITKNNYPQQINTLKETTLDNIEMTANQITRQIKTNRPKMLCLNIPYSAGWSAAVDGESAKIYRANEMYLALALEEGEHEIKLIYRTPGLKAGAWISFGAIGISAILFLVQRHSKKRAAK